MTGYKYDYVNVGYYLCDQVNLVKDVNMYQTRLTNGLNVLLPFPSTGKEAFKNICFV